MERKHILALGKMSVNMKCIDKSQETHGKDTFPVHKAFMKIQ